MTKWYFKNIKNGGYFFVNLNITKRLLIANLKHMHKTVVFPVFFFISEKNVCVGFVPSDSQKFLSSILISFL